MGVDGEGGVFPTSFCIPMSPTTSTTRRGSPVMAETALSAKTSAAALGATAPAATAAQRPFTTDVSSAALGKAT